MSDDASPTSSANPTQPKKQRLGLSTQILIALAAGVACGLFFGEYCESLEVIGEVFIGLLQMTVLPYITVAMVTNIGRLSFAQGKSLFLKGALVLLLLWAIALAAVATTAMAFPEMQVGSFFSTTVLEEPSPPDIVGLFIPFNVFNALVQDVVPAVVVFCIFMGLALMGIEGKEPLLDFLDVISQALMRVNGYVVKLTPIGVFAMLASTAGTLTVEEFGRIQGYLLAYTLLVGVLTFWVFPSLIAAVTPFKHLEVLRSSRTALITAFATGKVLIVLPMLIESSKELFHDKARSEDDVAESTVDVLYPLAYPFPHAGKLVGLLFIPFAAWFLGRPLGLTDYPVFLGTGLLSYFGGPIVATPFLLGLAQLPLDMMQLFLVSGIYCGRLGDLLGVMHLMAFTLITTSAMSGLLRVHIRALTRGLCVTAAMAFVCIFGTRTYLARTFEGAYQKTDVLAIRNTIDEPVDFVVLETSEPSPVPLEPGQSRLDRMMQRGTLRVGFDPQQFPFSFFNRKGELVGFDVEMAHEFARESELRIEFVPMNLNDANERLEADHVDVVMSGLVANLVRAAETEISQAYMDVHGAFIVRDKQKRDFETIESIRELRNLTLAIADETIALAVHRHLPDAGIRNVETIGEFFESTEPIADALIISAEAGFAWTIVYPEYSVVVPRELKGGVPLAYALPRNDTTFKNFFDHWIELVSRDGTIDRLYDHWILGKQEQAKEPRWSIIRDVLGWVE
jgi:Na+/H+-dicarboxylate symporter/ABC-type amino acid transport substrate-binding protein